MARARGIFRFLPAGLVGVALAFPASLTVAGQEQFQFVVSATDATGKPVTDLKPEEVVMTEKGVANHIVKIEPFHIPVKLTLAVDNGPLSGEALTHYRSGLAGLVKALPAGEVEIAVITIAPQPRRVVPPTTDMERILRGINGFASQSESPRFTDSLVEFSKRFEDELKETKKIDSLPVIVLISTTANEAASYGVPEIQKALGFLQARKAKVYVAMVAVRSANSLLGDLNARRDALETDLRGVTDLNTNRQALIAIPATKATNGRYEALAVSSRLATLLPEFGEEIAALHRKHYNQVLVTVSRQEGLKGPLQDPRVELTRPGLTGQVSLNGLP